MALVIVEVKNRDAWEIAEEIRVILGQRAKIVETERQLWRVIKEGMNTHNIRDLCA